MSEFKAKGSGWSLYSVNRIELNVNYFDPIYGSSYIDSLKEIKDNKAIINDGMKIKNVLCGH